MHTCIHACVHESMNSLSCSCIDPSFLSLHLRNNFISFHSRCIRSFHVFQSFLALALDKQARFGVYSSHYTCSAHFSHPIHPSVHPSIRPSIHPSVRPSVRSFLSSHTHCIDSPLSVHPFFSSDRFSLLHALPASLPPSPPSVLPACLRSFLPSFMRVASFCSCKFIRSFVQSVKSASKPANQTAGQAHRQEGSQRVK